MDFECTAGPPKAISPRLTSRQQIADPARRRDRAGARPLATEQLVDLFDHGFGHPGDPGVGVRCDMRRDDHVRHRQKRVRHIGRLGVEDVKAGARKVTVLERLDECRFVDDGASADVDEIRARRHQPELAVPDEMPGFRRQRRVERQEVRPGKEFVEALGGLRPFTRAQRLGGERIVDDHAHPEPEGSRSRRPDGRSCRSRPRRASGRGPRCPGARASSASFRLASRRRRAGAASRARAASRRRVRPCSRSARPACWRSGRPRAEHAATLTRSNPIPWRTTMRRLGPACSRNGAST